MYITNITDYDNMTDDYNNNNCTNNDNNIEIIIPLITIIPCGWSLICLISLMVYTLIKPLFNNKWWINISTQLILFVVSLPDLANVVKVFFYQI